MKIGIVNDLPMAVEALRRAVAIQPDHQVVWTAASGEEAVRFCKKETPDLVLMDLVMPGMDGVEATRRIMAATPCAILIVTVSVGANASRVFDAMGYGALDAVDTPVLGIGDPIATSAPLLEKIDAISRLIGKKYASPSGGEGVPARLHRETKRLIAIGASAGGPSALATLLQALPKTLPAAIVVVQHVDVKFAAGMCEWLNRSSQLPVKIAKESDEPVAGTVLLAGTNDHLVFKTPSRLGYTSDPIDYSYRPSVDVFFHSVVRLWQGEAVGVLLTGMGRDGALGLKALRDKGHYTIAQDQATSAVYGMPKAAAELHAAVALLPLESIAGVLSKLSIKKHYE